MILSLYMKGEYLRVKLQKQKEVAFAFKAAIATKKPGSKINFVLKEAEDLKRWSGVIKM